MQNAVTLRCMKKNVPLQKDSRLESLLTRLALSSDAQRMMSLAHQHHVVFALKENTLTGASACLITALPEIQLCTKEDDDVLVAALAHELRRFEQSLTITDDAAHPLNNIFLMRLLEGDTLTSTIKILADLAQSGDPNPLDRELMGHNMPISLTAQLLTRPANGVTVKREALRNIFKEAQADLQTCDHFALLNSTRWKMLNDQKGFKSTFHAAVKPPANIEEVRNSLKLSLDGKQDSYLRNLPLESITQFIASETMKKAQILNQKIHAEIKLNLQPTSSNQISP